MHENARSAAIAAECAASQSQFSGYHDFLFQHQDSLGQLDWVSLAARLHLPDTVAFARCLTDSSTIAKLRLDSLAGEKLHVRGTPTMLVNDQLVSGAMAFARIDTLIQAELEEREGN
jgi:protein-disulfide isomerase